MKVTPLAQSRFAEILLVDDNEDDVYLTREAFDSARLRVHLNHVDDGVKCLQYLRKEGPYAQALTPDLVLLDMHMPLMDGHDVLAEVVKDERLRHLPVVALTTSYEAADIQKMYALRCSSYITQPVDFESFTKAISHQPSAIIRLAGYWLTVVVVPEQVA